ncbi:hypothetical protein [Massilia timonae]|uniref:hypothetical protein n=1 Tax=Massilia timonae TaxID=47229 RepID=UPI00289D0D39|nr:hypothetical protein [Massilia timonae]
MRYSSPFPAAGARSASHRRCGLDLRCAGGRPQVEDQAYQLVADRARRRRH